MEKTIVAATGNAHKLKEFRAILKGWSVLSAKEAGFFGDVEETGATFAQNAEYELTVTRVGQVVDVTVKQGANAVTTKFTDISFVGVDNTKMYLCLFANRGLTVEFSSLSFEITGEAQGA